MNEVASPSFELTQEQRFTWGECPVCKVQHGERCLPVGIPLGLSANGGFPENGVHLRRLQQAPMRVRMVPA